MNFLGTTLHSPFEIINGKPILSSNVDNIKKSLNRILSTPIGTKFFLPEYGCRIHELQFEQNDLVLQSLLKIFIAQAINTWEKRVILKNIDTTVNNETCYCSINFKVIANNSNDTFIYPFYKNIIY